jgi:hypothetical protein
VVGGAALTVHVREAGVESALPAASMARTSKVCTPLPSPEYAFGEVHVTKAARSSRHSNVESVSAEEKPKLADEEVEVPLGPDVIAVSGSVVSTVQVLLAGLASTLPAASVARTSKVCEPAASAG